MTSTSRSRAAATSSASAAGTASSFMVPESPWYTNARCRKTSTTPWNSASVPMGT